MARKVMFSWTWGFNTGGTRYRRGKHAVYIYRRWFIGTLTQRNPKSIEANG